MESGTQELQYLNTFAHIMTRTQTKEVGLWGKKEFQRALGWAKCIEQVVSASGENAIDKMLQDLHSNTRLGFFSRISARSRRRVRGMANVENVFFILW